MLKLLKPASHLSDLHRFHAIGTHQVRLLTTDSASVELWFQHLRNKPFKASQPNLHAMFFDVFCLNMAPEKWDPDESTHWI